MNSKKLVFAAGLALAGYLLLRDRQAEPVKPELPPRHLFPIMPGEPEGVDYSGGEGVDMVEPGQDVKDPARVLPFQPIKGPFPDPHDKDNPNPPRYILPVRPEVPDEFGYYIERQRFL